MTFLLLAAGDLVLIALAVPLLRRRVKPNDLYGLRVEATFADEWVWYEANAQTARDMLVVGLAHLGVTALLPLVPGVSDTAYAVVNIALLLMGVVGMAVIGWRRAERLLARRRAATSP
ncbi:MAG TPA: SdpI family protein [Thermoanaerobaculia bacterium]|nr:SdpI family protein [Thermoanaerobaculia bacterium]